MLGTLMIIGLTVDYSTHTVVHYYNKAVRHNQRRHNQIDESDSLNWESIQNAHAQILAEVFLAVTVPLLQV